MSIYYKEKAAYFNRAMKSIWDDQSIKPNEIVLVQDGKLTDELYFAIDEWKYKLGETLKVVKLEKNLGLGDALNEGIKICSYELVARMDTDDISYPTRFEKQLKIFENNNIDICSSWVSEFETIEENIISYRKLPEKHDEIMKFSKIKNPINHPSVMFKKTIVEKAGGYKKMVWFEDYYLWARMILNGAKIYNIQEPLVNMRSGLDLLKRRSGFKYILSEIKFLCRMKNIGFLSKPQFIKNILIRTTARILPKKILFKLYRTPFRLIKI